MRKLAQDAGVRVASAGSSTLRDLDLYVKLMGKKQGTYVKSYGAFLKVCPKAFLNGADVTVNCLSYCPKYSSTYRVVYDRVYLDLFTSFGSTGLQRDTEILSSRALRSESF